MNLREWRESRELSLAQAGALVDVAAATWYRWETGQRQPRPRMMRRLMQATANAVTPNDIIAGCDPTTVGPKAA